MNQLHVQVFSLLSHSDSPDQPTAETARMRSDPVSYDLCFCLWMDRRSAETSAPVQQCADLRCCR